MVRMLLTSMLALASAPAMAQQAQPYQPPPAPPMAPPPVPADGVANGFQLDLNLLNASGFGSLTSVFAGAGAGSFAAVAPSVGIGYFFDQNAVTVNVGFGAAGGGSAAFGVAAGGTSILFGIAPTFRHYFTPLRLNQVSPFFQGSVLIDILAPSSGPTFIGFGFEGGGGAEWLFVKNFGLFARAALGYGHLNTGPNYDAIGIDGSIGISLHL